MSVCTDPVTSRTHLGAQESGCRAVWCRSTLNLLGVLNLLREPSLRFATLPLASKKQSFRLNATSRGFKILHRVISYLRRTFLGLICLPKHKGDTCDLVQHMLQGWRWWSRGTALRISLWVREAPGSRPGCPRFAKFGEVNT